MFIFHIIWDHQTLVSDTYHIPICLILHIASVLIAFYYVMYAVGSEAGWMSGFWTRTSPTPHYYPRSQCCKVCLFSSLCLWLLILLSSQLHHHPLHPLGHSLHLYSSPFQTLLVGTGQRALVCYCRWQSIPHYLRSFFGLVAEVLWERVAQPRFAAEELQPHAGALSDMEAFVEGSLKHQSHPASIEESIILGLSEYIICWYFGFI